ncbi:nitroreductase family deazaflavin-dependent oxidoreductase [Kitasatospora xanthocidica]|uniref:Nitroreductase family deazaflavin-dependent oxidoreductase n=1 Tax=Kitasatospora xanthocidica TaxID=83382 RepID=A0A372ZV89_9ACTN|nr:MULTISPECIES: nitroreductase/quinone reductase family protein [Streptomycetaceae]RGD59342.1 nitroreductase family deazaflavin-dependent oxidoreductase [Kitasatospora xanthocidica]
MTDETRPGPSGRHPEPADGAGEFNRNVIAEFRTRQGAVGGPLADAPVLLLTVVGARSGEPRTTPLVYLPDGGRLVVFASNGGSEQDPLWYRNLVAHPEVTVEVGAERYPALAAPVDPAEHDALWARQIAAQPQFAGYRTTARTVPLVALSRA